MKRPRLLSSPISFALLLFLFTGLSWTLWRSGGMAFSPGAVSAKSLPGIQLGGFDSHADFEGECWRCHQPLHTNQAGLCLECHTRTAEEITGASGLHGALESSEDCFICHSEHQGRDFDPGLFALTHFDHTRAQFDLVWHQVNYDASPMDCFSCHTTTQEGFGLDPQACRDCHSGHEPEYIQRHVGEFGQGCLDCHDGVDRLAGFDHNGTGFPLEGRHTSASCAACHGKDRQWVAVSTEARDPFTDTPRECVRCHNEPEVHLGLFGSDCQDCHTPQAWLPAFLEGAAFDHTAGASFTLNRHMLDFQGLVLTCISCHQDDIEAEVISRCIDCHASQAAGFMTSHQELFGGACLDCHDGVDRLSDFDHENIFPLAGRHAELDCSDCHQDKAFRRTPAECGSCHTEPEIHMGFFGSKCQYCHTDEAWLPAFLHMHAFPLDHGQESDAACTTCHIGTYTEYTCYACHDHQAAAILESHTGFGITSMELPSCASCHPSGLRNEEHGLQPETPAP